MECCGYIQNQFLHSWCVHNRPGCAGLMGAITTMKDVYSTIFKLYAPFSNMLHSHYAISMPLYQMAIM
jgi:hypothetical protein